MAIFLSSCAVTKEEIGVLKSFVDESRAQNNALESETRNFKKVEAAVREEQLNRR